MARLSIEVPCNSFCALDALVELTNSTYPNLSSGQPIDQRCKSMEYANPFERPVFLSEMILTLDNSPKRSNSLVSQSSSTFHDSWPTKRFFGPVSSSLAVVLDFLAAGTTVVSALRFFDATASSSDDSSESEADSDEPELSESSADDA